MNEKADKDNHRTAYEKRNLPISIIIKVNELSYKGPPLKDKMFKYWCMKKKCNYFVKINEDNIKKVINIITYEEFNQHSNHVDNNISNQI